MTGRPDALDDLHAHLGYKPLSPTWAKLEIFFGLAAAGIGLFLGDWAVARAADTLWVTAAGALALFVLGSYLALAGHRSHLYQSANDLTAFLAERIANSKDKG